MNNSVWVALAGWCLISVQLVLNILGVPLIVTHLLMVVIMLDFGLAIILAAQELFRVDKKQIGDR